MSEQPLKEEIVFIIKELEIDPGVTQRDISHKLGISVGKTNYLLKALVEKGFIKVKHFTRSPGKLERISYILTPKGLEEKTRLIQHFLKRKETEYGHLKQEWEETAVHRVKESAVTF